MGRYQLRKFPERIALTVVDSGRALALDLGLGPPMSAFRPVPSALPQKADAALEGRLSRLMTQSGHDGSPSRSTQAARHDRCVPRRSKCAPLVRNVQGPDFSSPHQPDQERATAYRDSSVPESLRDSLRATIDGDWEEQSGESRFKQGETDMGDKGKIDKGKK